MELANQRSIRLQWATPLEIHKFYEDDNDDDDDACAVVLIIMP